VHFSGQQYGSFSSYGKDPVDYALGEEAFRIDLQRLSRSGPNKEASDSAIRFITSRIADSTATQVRWAILYLGECRSPDNVPLLLKHIDYHYTSCQIVEESYPTVRALTQIGTPASSAAIKVLPNEHNALRLRLLCHTILRIDGTEKGKARIEEILPYVKDDAQTKRLQTALKQALAEQR